MKRRQVFVCDSCGVVSPKWQGRCPHCEAWNSFSEECAGARHDAGPAAPVDVAALDGCAEDEGERLSTASPEIDAVLGGGLTLGSVSLLTGEPGIGKSTLLLQIGAGIAATPAKTLYVSGEESAAQVRARAERLGIRAPGFFLLAETDVERILATVAAERPHLLLVDSIQTLVSERVPGASGGVTQVREIAGRLVRLAKSTGIAVIVVGHVTKDGSVAGPKVLEHIVDTVLTFEGDAGKGYRMLRAVKNRFGATNEFAMFEMTGGGLSPVSNPSLALIAERPGHVAGSLVIPSAEGARPLLVEVQALVSKSPSHGPPKRLAVGIDPIRLSLLLAVLERRANLVLSDRDVFVNVVGGFQISEPATDLGVVLAVCSSLLDVPVDLGTVAWGEVGLAGEVRSCQRVEARLREAAQLGFSKAVLPKNGAPLDSCGVQVVTVTGIQDALFSVLGFSPQDSSIAEPELVALS
ncbi:MAG: DNA repair protein RadA [Deltaproteobacteria bacterium]|nr:DNA repair protein RadA [Deltaproteobacteria bacterium]